MNRNYQQILIILLFIQLCSITFQATAQNRQIELSGELIENQPAGETFTNLTRSSFAFYPDGTWTQRNAQGNYTIGTDGNIYVLNPLSRRFSFAYMKLTPDPERENIYIMHPQPIEHGYTEGTYRYLLPIICSWDGSNLDFAIDEEDPNIEFEFKNGILKQLNPGEIPDGNRTIPRRYIGLVDHEYKLMDHYTGRLNIAPLDVESTTLPAGIQPQTFGLTWYDRYNRNYSRQVQVAITDTDVYIESPYKGQDEGPRSPVQWLHGTREGNTVTLPQQFIGPVEDYLNTYVFLNAAKAIQYTTQDGKIRYSLQPAEQVILTYNPETNSLSGAEDIAMLFTDDFDAPSSFDDMIRPKFSHFTNQAMTPATPSIISVNPYDQEEGEGYILFSIAESSDQGDYLQASQLYYNIFTDGNTTPITFSKPTYDDMRKAYTDIPYAYKSSSTIHAAGNEHLIFIKTPFTNVGVRTIYTGGGERRTSPIVWYDKADVTDLSSTNATPVATHYYDLMGRRITHPQAGIYVRHQLMSDGTSHTTKIIR